MASRLPSGVLPILLATAITGGAGYVVNAIVPIVVSPSVYAEFSILWSVLFFILAAMGGVQQEVTRAAAPRAASDARRNPAFRFAVLSSILVAVVMAAALSFALPALLGAGAQAAAVPIAIAAGSYLFVAVLSGVLYGLHRWRLIAVLVGLDGLIRLLAVAIVLALHTGIIGLIWAIAVPVPLAPLLVWSVSRGSVRGASQLDVSFRRLGWNAVRALLAAAASGVLISGFPILLAATSPGLPRAELAGVNLGINLVRAPLVIVVLSLQSYLVVQFRRDGAAAGSLLRRMSLLILGAALVIGAAAAAVGPWILALFGSAYALGGLFIGGLVLLSGLLGVLCVSGAATIATNAHGFYVAGWLAAAAASVIALLLPLGLETRVMIALASGPTAGLVVHLYGLRPRRAAAGSRPAT